MENTASIDGNLVKTDLSVWLSRKHLVGIRVRISE